MQAYKELYLKTAQEHIETILQNITRLEKNLTDSAAIDDIEIHAHSLKGGSRVIGYAEIAKLNETIEHTFKDIKNNIKKLTPQLLSQIQTAMQTLTASLDDIKNDRDLTPIYSKLKQIQTSIQTN